MALFEPAYLLPVQARKAYSICKPGIYLRSGFELAFVKLVIYFWLPRPSKSNPLLNYLTSFRSP